MTVKTGQIDLELASNFFGGFYCVWLWLKFGDIIKQYREILNIPFYYENFEYLVNRLIEFNNKRGTPIDYDGWAGTYTPPKVK